MVVPKLTIDALIDKRDYDHKVLTKKAFDMVEQPLTEVAKRVIGHDRRIVWISIERAKIHNQYVNVRGLVLSEIGDTIMVSGKPVVITEQNASDYDNFLTLTCAVRVIETMNVEKIHAHVQFVINVIQNNPESVVAEMLNRGIENEFELYTDPAHKAILEKVTRPRYVDGFDTAELTETQYEALRTTINSVSGTGTDN